MKMFVGHKKLVAGECSSITAKLFKKNVFAGSIYNIRIYVYIYNSAYIVKIMRNFSCILCCVFFLILKYRCISKSLCI